MHLTKMYPYFDAHDQILYPYFDAHDQILYPYFDARDQKLDMPKSHVGDVHVCTLPHLLGSETNKINNSTLSSWAL